ncbi:hypothetical protein NEF87_002377 [Candidatus Lokiarchaeum ossiferum]|uniref:HTH arsR-type domain-containing protein n=1 Tax=Candidatus Lokiarchaeum ossiferum TaxID=2951803 RepID=A0ABY6HT90_9ARCH|nr:hypothetical protein NEF87_002377 [Candidatus Lokiarchaeum sp. B-35]
MPKKSISNTEPRNRTKLDKNSHSIVNILKSKSKFQIYSLLEMYPEISLNHLCLLLKKKKPTVHGHLKTLIDVGLVAEPHFKSVESDPSLGKSKKNVQAFYSLVENYQDLLKEVDPNPEILDDLSSTVILDQIATSKAISNINIMNLTRVTEFFNKVEKKILKEGKVSEELETLFKSMVGVETDRKGIDRIYSEFTNSFYYFTEEQFHKYRLAYNTFMENFLNTIEFNKTDSKRAKPNYIMSVSIPMKKIIEFLNQ